MCVSQSATRILDPAGFIAGKANMALAPAALRPYIGAFSSASGTQQAYSDYKKSMEPPPAPPVPGAVPTSGAGVGTRVSMPNIPVTQQQQSGLVVPPT